MNLIRGIDQLNDTHRPSVVSIGNFDGVHLGHQYLIKTLLEAGERLGAPSTVVTFEPLAKEYFRPNSIMRLSSIEERSELLFALGVDNVLCVQFTSDFATYSPTRFISDVLVKGLGARYLSVGDDFRFGKDRAGDFALLEKVGAKQGFEVSAHDTFRLYGERVSSGRVRTALAAADFDLAESLLGRRYTISGEVSLGQQLGRTLDYPTANIVLEDCLLAVNGVYAVGVTLESGEQVEGVANIGKRPTVDGKENRLEVHLFDFDQDIYGQHLVVSIEYKIRDEQKFDSIEQLKKQISRDADAARGFFAA